MHCFILKILNVLNTIYKIDLSRLPRNLYPPKSLILDLKLYLKKRTICDINRSSIIELYHCFK